MESNNIALKISKIGTISISEFLLSISQKIIYLNSMIDFYGQSQTFSELNKIQIFDPTTISEKKKNSMGPTVFCFQITDGSKKWTIRRRLSDLLNLEKTIYKKLSLRDIKKTLSRIEFTPNSQLDFFEEYLQRAIIYIENLKEEKNNLYQFFEKSDLQINSNKYKETFIKKRSGGRYSESQYLCRCGALFKCWQKRYFAITSEGIMYSKLNFNKNKNEATILELLLFDNFFSFCFGISETGLKKGVLLDYSSRRLLLELPSTFEYFDFISCLLDALHDSPYHMIQKYGSFAPIRRKVICKSLLDGEEYYEEVYNKLLNAEKEVFITGWWVSPELYLKRPAENQDEGRLDRILKKIVKEKGIHIKIILYQESKIALSIDSAYTKNKLEKIDPNIIVLRHPNYILPFSWSHHEKMIIIDQKVGFMGGLDLCYGRYDNNSHNITEQDPNLFPGMDYSNPRIADFQNVHNHHKSLIDREKTPRMAWHDVGIMLEGESVKDLARHFIQYWNFVNFDLRPREDREFLMVNRESEKLSLQINPIKRLWDSLKRKWDGRTSDSSLYYELEDLSVRKHKSLTSSPLQKNLKLTASLSLQLSSRNISDFDMNRLIIQRENSPNSNSPINAEKRLTFTGKIKSFFNEKKKTKLLASNIRLLTSYGTIGSCECQLVRSGSNWSLGLDARRWEESVHIAYLTLIKNSEHYIYIENQFFISGLAGSPVLNGIAEAIFERINKAWQNKEKFKVIIVLPLLPAFEGELDGNSAAILRIQLHWQFKTICRGKDSLLGRLESIMDHPEEYLKIFGLRNHGVINGVPKTEMIYVHSKLMIIDDRIAIIGSANINDRSMLGNRDSEIALVINDNCFVDGIMNDKEFQGRKFAFELRMKIFKEHFQLKKEELLDPLSSEFWDTICKNAKKNTEIYRDIFRCYPDDQIKISSSIKEYKEISNISLYDTLIKDLKGFIVEYPLKFLENEDLRFSITNKEFLVGEINFT